MPTYDYKAARKAGLSNTEIATHIASRRRQGVDLKLAPEDEAALQQGQAAGAPRAMIGGDPLRLGARAGTAAPDILGFAGGMAPGWPGIGLSAAGGFAGEGIKEASLSQPLDLGKMAASGAAQGGITAASLGAGRLGGVLTGKTAARAMAEAENLARGSKLRIDRGAILSGIRQLESEAHLLGEREVKNLRRLKISFMDGPKDMTAHMLHELRQHADKISEKIVNAAKEGKTVGPNLALKGRFWKGIADQSRRILKEGVPGYKKAMRSIQGAQTARQIAERGIPAAAGAGVGAVGAAAMGGGHVGSAIGAAGGAGMGANFGRAVANPATGELLETQGMKRAIQLTPRLIDQLLQQSQMDNE